MNSEYDALLAELKSAVNRMESASFRLAEREPVESRLFRTAVAEGAAVITRAEAAKTDADEARQTITMLAGQLADKKEIIRRLTS